MNGQTLAHVRRVLSGPDRTLIHAVTGAGHDLKLEVPAEAVRDLEPGRGFVLMVSWSLLELPPAPAEVAAGPTSAPSEPRATPAATATPATTDTPATPATPANAVDAAFMALMTRSRRDGPTPATAASPASTAAGDADPERQIAALLGLAPKP